MVEVIEYHGGSVTDDQALVRYERDLEAHLPEDKRSSEETLKRRAKDKMLGVALIRRADRGRYGKLMTDLKDQYLDNRWNLVLCLNEIYFKIIIDQGTCCQCVVE